MTDPPDLEAELDGAEQFIIVQAAILTEVANALKGLPGPQQMHPHHDLGVRAIAMVDELDQCRRALERLRGRVGVLEEIVSAAYTAAHMQGAGAVIKILGAHDYEQKLAELEAEDE